MNVKIDTIRRKVFSEKRKILKQLTKIEDEMENTPLNQLQQKKKEQDNFQALIKKCDYILLLIQQYVLTNNERLFNKIQDKYQELLLYNSHCKIDGFGDYGLENYELIF